MRILRVIANTEPNLNQDPKSRTETAVVVVIHCYSFTSHSKTKPLLASFIPILVTYRLFTDVRNYAFLRLPRGCLLDGLLALSASVGLSTFGQWGGENKLCGKASERTNEPNHEQYFRIFAPPGLSLYGWMAGSCFSCPKRLKRFQ